MSEFKFKALMVEDMKMAQLVATELISHLNGDLKVVSMANHGFEEALIAHYDIIFIDIQLPNIDGLSLVKAIRQVESSDKRIPLIAVTAHMSEEVKARAKAAGCDEILPKPLRIEALRAVLDKYLLAESHIKHEKRR